MDSGNNEFKGTEFEETEINADEFNELLEVLKTEGGDVRPGRLCPSGEQLGAYFEGTLGTTEARRVRRHLTRCDFCAQSLDILAEAREIERTAREAEGMTTGSEWRPRAADREPSSPMDARIAMLVGQPRNRFLRRLRRFRLNWSLMVPPPNRRTLALALSTVLLVIGSWTFLHHRWEIPRGEDVAIYAYTPTGVKGGSPGQVASANRIRPGDLLRVDIPDRETDLWWHGLFIDEGGQLHDGLVVPPLIGVASTTLVTDTQEEPYVRLEIGAGVRLLEIPAGRFFGNRTGAYLALFFSTAEPISPSSRKELVARIRTLRTVGEDGTESGTTSSGSLQGEGPWNQAETAILEWGRGKIKGYDIDALTYQAD